MYHNVKKKSEFEIVEKNSAEISVLKELMSGAVEPCSS